jgi:hypothetical protein
MITLISHDGTCCIGINMDAAAITDPVLFQRCLDQGIDEILALNSTPPATPRGGNRLGSRPRRRGPPLS